MARHCTLCPLACGADRTTRRGACGGGTLARVAKYGLHPFEEPCISCKNGSGTVFFGGCSLGCAFCQNYALSHGQAGNEVSARELSHIFAELEEMGAENINLVTASHYVPQLLEEVPHLVIAVDHTDRPAGFMGIAKKSLEMLFITPELRGHGIGKQLLKYGIKTYSIETLTVNEQNPQAMGFYEHMGFQVYKRTELDEQGNPYPLLYMKYRPSVG